MSEPDAPVLLHRTESLVSIMAVLDDPGDGLNPELQRSVIVRYLKEAVVSHANKEMVLQLPSDHAGKLINVMQEILDDPESYHPGSSADESFLRAIFRLFMRLAQHSKVLPPNLFLTGVALECRDPISLGGFSDVFKGTYMGNVVALKRLRVSMGDLNGDDYFHRTFYREALLWRQLRHRYVLPFIGIDRDTFASSGFFCMISPWMHKGTIREFSKGNIGVSERLRLLQEVAEGMAYLHSRHVVHGDIRGLNIFIDDGVHVQLADFGLSAIGDKTSVGIATATKESGAKRWMAPELLDPERFMMQFERTPPSDTFAFGSVCLEVFTGRPPFFEVPNEVTVMFRMLEGNIPRRPALADSFGHGVPDELWVLMRGCWAYRPAERPTMQTIATAIDELRPRSPKTFPAPMPSTPLIVAVPSTLPQPSPIAVPARLSIDTWTTWTGPIVEDLISFDIPADIPRVSSTSPVLPDLRPPYELGISATANLEHLRSPATPELEHDTFPYSPSPSTSTSTHRRNATGFDSFSSSGSFPAPQSTGPPLHVIDGLEQASATSPFGDDVYPIAARPPFLGDTINFLARFTNKVAPSPGIFDIGVVPPSVPASPISPLPVEVADYPVYTRSAEWSPPRSPPDSPTPSPRTLENVGALVVSGPAWRRGMEHTAPGPLFGPLSPTFYEPDAVDVPRASESPWGGLRSLMGYGGKYTARGPSVSSGSGVVFGVPLEESLRFAEIEHIPAVVFRCIQYLEVKGAENEEGIYRLSGSAAVIKALKARFDADGDVDLAFLDAQWDLHAIAGLLKTYLRELPTQLLPLTLFTQFVDLSDRIKAADRVRQLSHLIARLPAPNYWLLRALFAHLVLVVQHAHVNKMTASNLKIVFTPTLGIPANVLGLMLDEFDRVFSVDAFAAARGTSGSPAAPPAVERPLPAPPSDPEERDEAQGDDSDFGRTHYGAYEALTISAGLAARSRRGLAAIRMSHITIGDN